MHGHERRVPPVEARFTTPPASVDWDSDLFTSTCRRLRLSEPTFARIFDPTERAISVNPFGFRLDPVSGQRVVPLTVPDRCSVAVWYAATLDHGFVRCHITNVMVPEAMEVPVAA